MLLGTVSSFSAEPRLGPAWVLEGDARAGQFGYCVAAGDVNGDGFPDVLVGARVHPQPYWRAGRAFVFYGSANGPQAVPGWTMAGTEPEERFAETVACADVNGDGMADVLIGSWMHRNRRGAVWLFLGSKEGPSRDPDWQVEGDTEGLCLGYALCHAGDVNADGFADVLVGAPFHSQVERWPGRAYIFYGGPQGLKPTADWSFRSQQRATSLGGAVAAAGDVNGDGFADVLVSEAGYLERDRQTGRLHHSGRVLAFYGSASGLAREPSWTALSEERFGSGFGRAISGAGDVNGDGFADVLIGAHKGHEEGREEGKVYLYLGSSKGLASQPAWVARGRVPEGLFGWSISAAGDVDRDGFADVIIGGARFPGPGTNFIRTWLFRGGASGLREEPDWVVEQNLAFAEPGVTVKGLGDLDQDGYSDVAVAAWLHKSVEHREGQVWIYAGSSRGLAGSMLNSATEQMARGWYPRPRLIPWWRRPWLLAVGVVVVLAAAGAGGVRAVELRAIRRRLRALEHEQALARERTRIAQDMHDHLGASLTRLTWLSELTKTQLAGTEPARARVEELASGARELARTVDEIVWALNPQKDKLENLASYLAAYAEEFLRPTGLRCRLHFPETLPPLRLSSEARHSLFLAVKEALNNAVKHARATEIRLHVKVENGALCCLVEDDGCGFCVEGVKPERNGLTNLRQRLEALGGRLAVTSQPGAGTRVRMEVPLPR